MGLGETKERTTQVTISLFRTNIFVSDYLDLFTLFSAFVVFLVYASVRYIRVTVSRLVAVFLQRLKYQYSLPSLSSDNS